MSFKKYRFIDLTTLIILGIITEALGTYFSTRAIAYYNPYGIVSLALICLAITRYGAWGSVCIPVFALTNSLTYSITSINDPSLASQYASNSYYVIRGIGVLLIMCSPLILLYLYKDGTNLYLSSINKVFKLTSIVSAISFIVSVTFTIMGAIIFKKTQISPSMLGYTFLQSIGYLAIGLISMYLINPILYRQGSFANAYETFVEREYEKKNEYEYYNVRNLEESEEKMDSEIKKSDEESDTKGLWSSWL